MASESFQIPFGSTSGLTSGINRVTNSLSSVTRGLTLASDDLAEQFQDMVIDTFIGIKDGTPVDTGKAQAGWDLKRSFVDRSFLEFEISNSVHYIGLLEFGKADNTPHSTKKPMGMVRTNLLELEQKLKGLGKGMK